MRHRKHKFKLNRTTSHRKSLEANLVKSLVMHGGIKTTIPKAKAFRSTADKMITLAKDGNLASIRKINAKLRVYRNKAAKSKEGRLASSNNVVIDKLIELAKIHENRKGGYSRIIRLGQRKGDAAEMCRLEYITISEK